MSAIELRKELDREAIELIAVCPVFTVVEMSAVVFLKDASVKALEINKELAIAKNKVFCVMQDKFFGEISNIRLSVKGSFVDENGEEKIRTFSVNWDKICESLSKGIGSYTDAAGIEHSHFEGFVGTSFREITLAFDTLLKAGTKSTKGHIFKDVVLIRPDKGNTTVLFDRLDSNNQHGYRVKALVDSMSDLTKACSKAESIEVGSTKHMLFGSNVTETSHTGLVVRGGVKSNSGIANKRA